MTSNVMSGVLGVLVPICNVIVYILAFIGFAAVIDYSRRETQDKSSDDE